MQEHRTIECKILDKDDRKLIAEGTIRVTQINSEVGAAAAVSYEGQFSFLDFLPDLVSKSVTLEIMPGLSGTVSLHAPPVQSATTRLGGLLNVSFDDSVWSGRDWFYKI